MAGPPGRRRRPLPCRRGREEEEVTELDRGSLHVPPPFPPARELHLKPQGRARRLGGSQVCPESPRESRLFPVRKGINWNLASKAAALTLNTEGFYRVKGRGQPGLRREGNQTLRCSHRALLIVLPGSLPRSLPLPGPCHRPNHRETWLPVPAPHRGGGRAERTEAKS